MDVPAEELFDSLIIWRFGPFSTGITINSLFLNETRGWSALSQYEVMRFIGENSLLLKLNGFSVHFLGFLVFFCLYRGLHLRSYGL